MDIEKKAVNLIKEGKVKKEMETDKRVHYVVEGTDEKHSVIFDKKTQKFSCDCKWSSLKDKECSHMIACRLFKE